MLAMPFFQSPRNHFSLGKVRAMHMANAPGAPTAAPFSPGSPDPGVGRTPDVAEGAFTWVERCFVVDSHAMQFEEEGETEESN